MQRFLLRVVRRSAKVCCLCETQLKARVGSFENKSYSTNAAANSVGHCGSGWVGGLASRIVQLEIVNALRGGQRERASAMLSEIARNNNSLIAEDFSHILEYCAEAPDSLFVMETWQTMQEKSVDLNKGTSRWIVRALSKGGYTKEALDWLTLFDESNATSNTLPTFNVFLSALHGSKNPCNFKNCLDKMDSRYIGKSEVTYLELLKVCLKRANSK